VTDPAAGQVPSNAHAVRDDDTFDVAAMHAWLTSHVPELSHLTTLPQVRQFVGGASNLTYLLSYPGRDLVMRRPPAGTKASSAHDMAREYLVQQRLKPVFRYVPQVLGLCQDHSVLGADFYVMEQIPGTILRANLPPHLSLSPAEARRLGQAAIGTLAELHAVDPEAAGLSQLSRGPGYVQRQVAGWSKRYLAVRTWNTPSFERVMAWLDDVKPDDAGSCLIHNDFRLDNLVLDPGDPLRVAGVLDWEMATVGDPLMDLGGAIAYWVQADDDWAHRQLRRQPTHLPGMMTRRQVIDFYAERTGRDLGDFTFYEVFGLFRLAVILQQIYYRYHHKQTTNPAFKNFWLMTGYLDWRCRRLIRQTQRTSPRTGRS
jgi:aminoglycoside phosphotransferase (APT) family kinase protein